MVSVEAEIQWEVIRFRAGDAGIDASYQSPERFDRKRAERIAAGWDWGRYAPIKLGLYPDGRMMVIDGQHRLHAARLRFGDEIELWGYIGEVTPEQAARLFAEADVNAARVSTAVKFKASRVYDDPETRLIDETAARYGWRVTTESVPRALRCIALLQRAVRAKGGPERLERCLRIVTSAWGTQAGASSHFILGGMIRFLREYGDRVDDRRLIEQLRKVAPEDVSGALASRYAVALGRGSRAATQNYYPVALVMRDLYNRQLHKARRLTTRVGGDGDDLDAA